MEAIEGDVDLASIPTWASIMEEVALLRAPNPRAIAFLSSRFAPGDPVLRLASRVRLWRGDITTLRVDAIVNAANNSCLGGGGIDGAIHDAAGRGLYDECRALPLLKGRTRCPTGGAVITGGHALPARFVVHTVGPTDGDAEVLASCYRESYALARRHGLRSICFNCIATGIFGFPNVKAAMVALSSVEALMRAELSATAADGGGGGAAAPDGAAPAAEAGSEPLDVVFCVFLQKDLDIYEALMSYFFPPAAAASGAAAAAAPAAAAASPAGQPAAGEDDEAPAAGGGDGGGGAAALANEAAGEDGTSQ